MLRVAFLLIVFVFAILLSWQITSNDAGVVHFEWMGWQADTSAWFAIAILIAVIALALPLLRALRTRKQK